MVTTREIRYPADGRTMVGHLALPAGSDPRPAVLIGHEGSGLNDFQRRRADHLAGQGYVALALDFHGGRWFADPQEMLAHLEPLLADRDRLRALGHAGLEVLGDEPRADLSRVAAVGYGTGGTIALELGRDGVDLRTIVAINPVLATDRPGDASNIRCPVLVGVGSEDPIIGPDQREAFAAEMQAARVDWRMVVYGGAEHAFHHPPVRPDGSLAATHGERQPTLPGVGFHPTHARRAWRDLLETLEDAFTDDRGELAG